MTNKEFKNKVLPLSMRIYPMAARMLNNDTEAQDAVQEIMIKLWSNRKLLKKHPNVSGYVFLSARNYCLDQIKKKKPERLDDLHHRLVADLYVEPLENDFDDVVKQVQMIVAELPENQREIIIMRDLDGLEFDEIVAVLGIKIEHARVLLSRARKYVRVKLNKIYNYE